MEYIGGFFAVNTDALEWEDGSAILGLPEGVEIKAIREGYDEVSERTERFVRFPPGYVEPRHEHDHYHCIYILEGSGLYLREGVPPVPIQAGQFIIVPRNVFHGMRNTGGTRLSYLGVNGGAEPSA